MNKIIILITFFLISLNIYAQPIAGYYNGIEGLNQDNLKTVLHDIIDDHVEYSYSGAKEILKDSNSSIMSVSNEQHASWKKKYPSPKLMTLPCLIGIYAFIRLQAYFAASGGSIALIDIFGR